jgi:hypothetical protein
MADDVLHGVSLEQYAGVLAALGEGFSLGDVLVQESIDDKAWPDAERAWREAIASGPQHQLELVQKRRVAEECLGRDIDPIDDDPEAWVGLLGALALAEAPNDLLRGFGLTMGDVARVGRGWKRKAEKDPEVGKKLEELAPKAKPPAKIDVGPAKLKPFPWTVARAAAAAPEARAPAAPQPMAPLAESGPRAPERASYQLRPAELLEPARLGPSYLADRRPPAPAPAPMPAVSFPEPRIDADPFGATGAMPTRETVERLIAEAQPSVALERAAAREPASPGAAPKHDPLDDPLFGKTEIARPAAEFAEAAAKALPFAPAAADRVSTGTEAIGMDEIRRAMAAASASATNTPQGPNIGVLAAIAVDIRTGTAPAAAVAARGLTDGAWRAAQAAVVNDPAQKQAFEARVTELMRSRTR